MKTAESVLKSARENNEPVFVLRAKDLCSSVAIYNYLRSCELHGCSSNHINGIQKILNDFCEWQTNNSEKVRKPD